MGSCFSKHNKNDIISLQNEKNHKLIMASLSKIETNFEQMSQNNNCCLYKIESELKIICQKNEESTLANREQIDYLIENCASFGKRIKELENYMNTISKTEKIEKI
jgi:hypothetical protein